MRQRRGGTGHGKVDWELLADHLGGALAGTPEGERVAELVTTDPAWLAAATELSRGLHAVARDLRALPDPRMPDDVTARLDTALQQAVPRPERHRAGAPAARQFIYATRAEQPGGPPRAPAGAGRRGDRGRTPARPAPAGRTRRPRRLMRWSTGLAAAAGVMALTMVSFANWSERPPPVADRAEGSPATAPEALDAAPPDSGGDPLLTASGMDYSQQVLSGPQETAGEPSISGGQLGTGDPPEHRLDSAPPSSLPTELTRLWTDRPALAGCLAAVAGSFPTVVTVQSIDFARYQGRPALVMWVMTGDGTDWVSVSGPACGGPDAGPDLRLQTRLR